MARGRQKGQTKRVCKIKDAAIAPYEIYVEEVGNPTGIPILFVHGGPGYGCRKKDRRFFDPNYFRAILIDQRGA